MDKKHKTVARIPTWTLTTAFIAAQISINLLDIKNIVQKSFIALMISDQYATPQ